MRCIPGILKCAISVVLFGVSPAIAQQQEFPSQTINFVLPFAAGSGAVDTLARALAVHMKTQAGVPVMFNIPSGGRMGVPDNCVRTH